MSEKNSKTGDKEGDGSLRDSPEEGKDDGEA